MFLFFFFYLNKKKAESCSCSPVGNPSKSKLGKFPKSVYYLRCKGTTAVGCNLNPIFILLMYFYIQCDEIAGGCHPEIPSDSRQSSLLPLLSQCSSRMVFWCFAIREGKYVKTVKKSPSCWCSRGRQGTDEAQCCSSQPGGAGCHSCNGSILPWVCSGCSGHRDRIYSQDLPSLQGWGNHIHPVPSAWLGQIFSVKWNPYAGVTLNEPPALIAALSSLFPCHCLHF